MALWLNVEWETGEEERIPMLNREEVDLKGYVLTASVEQEYVTGRDDLTERRYRGADIERVIQSLREGDEVRVTTYPESYGDNILTIEKGGDRAIGVDEDGERFHLIPRFWGEQNQGDGQPWLRTSDGWDSRGEIEEVAIRDLVE